MFDAATAISLSPAEAYASLQEIIAAAHDTEAAWYPQWWASDALVLMGEYRRAAEEYPPPSSARSTMQTERLLSLKAIVGIPYVARDMVALLGPKVTTFGRQNLGLVTVAVETLIAEESSEQRIASLRRWAANAVARPYQVYIGSPYGYDASKSVSIKSYSFSAVTECVDYCLGIMRRAENMVRQEAGVPGVGEGWISETALFRETPVRVPFRAGATARFPTVAGPPAPGRVLARSQGRCRVPRSPARRTGGVLRGRGGLPRDQEAGRPQEVALHEERNCPGVCATRIRARGRHSRDRREVDTDDQRHTRKW